MTETPEMIAAAAIARAFRDAPVPLTREAVGTLGVEYISAAGLVILQAERVAAMMDETQRLLALLRRPAVWAAHAADPRVVAPECDCAVGTICVRGGCCYEGGTVPVDVRAALAQQEPQA